MWLLWSYLLSSSRLILNSAPSALRCGVFQQTIKIWVSNSSLLCCFWTLECLLQLFPVLLRELGSIGPLAFQVASSSECLFGVFIAALVNRGRDSQAFLKCHSPISVKWSSVLFSWIHCFVLYFLRLLFLLFFALLLPISTSNFHFHNNSESCYFACCLLRP